MSRTPTPPPGASWAPVLPPMGTVTLFVPGRKPWLLRQDLSPAACWRWVYPRCHLEDRGGQRQPGGAQGAQVLGEEASPAKRAKGTW